MCLVCQNLQSAVSFLEQNFQGRPVLQHEFWARDFLTVESWSIWRYVPAWNNPDIWSRFLFCQDYSLRGPYWQANIYTCYHVLFEDHVRQQMLVGHKFAQWQPMDLSIDMQHLWLLSLFQISLTFHRMKFTLWKSISSSFVECRMLWKGCRSGVIHSQIDECGNWQMHTFQTVLAPSIEEVNDIVERLPLNNNKSLIVRRWMMVNINSIQPRRGYSRPPGTCESCFSSRSECGSVLHKNKILSWHHIGRHT